MSCVGTLGAQFPREFHCPKIHQPLRSSEKQLGFVILSLEGPASPLLQNLPQNLQRIETVQRFCAFTPPLGFRSSRDWEVIDLVAQDSVLDPRGGVSFSPYGPGLRRQGKKLIFGLPTRNSYELRNGQASRKDSGLIRAERVSKERRSGRPESRKDVDAEGQGTVGEDSSMWDSNVEGVRRGRGKKRFAVNSELDIPQSSRFEKSERDDGDGESKMRDRVQEQEWGYDSEARTRDRSQEEDWDHDSRGKASSGETRREDFRRRESKEEYDAYESDDETGGASSKFKDIFSWLNMDIKDAFLFIRWGLPAAVLLVPWLMGNPMMLLLGLSFFPAAQKFVTPIANQIFRTVMSGTSPSKSKRKRKQSTTTSSSRTRQGSRTPTSFEREAPRYADREEDSDIFSSVSSTIFGDPQDDIPRKPPAVNRSVNRRAEKKLGGWEDLEEDRARSRTESWPMERRRRSETKLVRREQNVFIRLFLALFPFFRNWGGLM